jgi:hypothetical protein
MTLEAFLARLYTDPGLRRDFLARPVETAEAAGVDHLTAIELQRIDRDGLILAARSFEHKRKARR